MKQHFFLALTCALLFSACADESKQTGSPAPALPVSTVDSTIVDSNNIAPTVTQPRPVVLRIAPVGNALPASGAGDVTYFEEALADLLPSPQQYTIQGNRDTMLRGKEGTLLQLPAGCFVDGQGNAIAGNVQIELEEFYSNDAILAAGLHTQSRGLLLETGGMIYWTASSGGKALQIAPGARTSLAFPARKEQAGMQIFLGTDEGNGLDWQPVDDGGAQLLRGFEPALYPGGSPALANLFLRYVDAADVVLPGESRRYSLLIRVGEDGRGVLQQISPEGPDELRRSVQQALSSQRWQPARRVGVPTWDTARHYLEFNWSINFPIRDSAITPGEMRDILNGSSQRNIESPQQAVSNALYYTMYHCRIGWVNCDRFINDSRPRVEFVQRANTSQEQVKVICHSLRSYINGVPAGDGWHFSGLPKGERITVVGLRKTGDDFLVAFSELSAGDISPTLSYERMTPAQMRKRLESFDAVAGR
ncbi:MAG: hypothetical protein EOO15_00515 [Chitinophagaceae bacterium]|nr:MAG: hypothetical protein EOO15_00515 [Chitinophagaceae bacterium]